MTPDRHLLYIRFISFCMKTGNRRSRPYAYGRTVYAALQTRLLYTFFGICYNIYITTLQQSVALRGDFMEKDTQQIPTENKRLSLSVAVCDDEPSVRRELISQSTDYFAYADIDGRFAEFSDGESLLAAYQNHTADFQIVLLDIKMRDLNGISAAKVLRTYDADALIVFVTASAEYVFRGYEVKAFRYVLKTELSHAFRKILEECVRELCTTAKTYAFRTGTQETTVYLADILYFESSRRTVTLHTKQSSFIFYEKLDSIEKELRSCDFVRCHQSFLVNAKEIRTVKTDSLTLLNGDILPVSKSRREAVRKASLWAMR